MTRRMNGAKTKTTCCRPAYLILSLTLATILMMLSFLSNHVISQDRWYERPAPCRTPKHFIEEMANLTFIVSDVLTSFKIPHVLCYGTLWGALRLGRTLPWDNNIDICVKTEELGKASWAKLSQHLLDRNLDVSYSSSHGEISIKKGNVLCTITMFYTTRENKMVRDSWQNRYFVYWGRDLPFPEVLLKAPLPTMKFHGRSGIPVPWGDVELLKYLYKEDWWMEMPPPGCEGVS